MKNLSTAINIGREPTEARIIHMKTHPANLFINKIAIPGKAGIELIDSSTIAYCQAQGNYTKIFIKSKAPILVSMSLKYVMQKLPALEFIRIHQSYLVPVGRIRHIGQKQITLVDEMELPLSRRCRKKLMSYLS